jgi:putative transposase
VEQLGIDGMTKDRVSALCRALDEQVEAFRQRPLEGVYPYLWLDAKHVKVRDHGRVVSKALVVAYAVHESGGVREVIGLDVGEVVPFRTSILGRPDGAIEAAAVSPKEHSDPAVGLARSSPW